jgi:hypothetical protein
MSQMRKYVALFLFFLLLAWCGLRIYQSIDFKRQCGGYIDRAAIANTVEMAQKELETAVKCLEDRKLTEGYTSILYKTPDEDIGFWYGNLKASLGELQSLPTTSAPLEKTNVLIKLHESLQNKGETVYPQGISVYPYNVFIAIAGWLIPILLFIAIWPSLKNANW